MSLFVNKAKQYASYHTKNITKVTHFVGVPLIIFSLMIFFGFVKISVPGVFSTNLAWFLMIGVLVYYAKLNVKLAVSILPIFLIMIYLADMISSGGPTKGTFEIFLLFFVFGWVIQFVGHFYEKKKPAFMDNLSQLFIAPLFLVAEAYFYFGMLNDLYLEIYEADAEVVQQKNRERVEENTDDAI